MSSSEEEPVPIVDQQVKKNDVFAAIVTSANEYYKMSISVSTLFLGGTLLFLEKLVPENGGIIAMRLLGLGWLSLICSILSIAVVQHYNIVSGRHTMRGEIEKSQAIDDWSVHISSVAIATLTIGIVCIMIFGYLNLSRPKGEATVGNKVSVPDVTKTIPFGTTQPSSKPPAGTPGKPPAQSGGTK